MKTHVFNRRFLREDLPACVLIALFVLLYLFA